MKLDKVRYCRMCEKPLPETARYNTLYCPECAELRKKASQKRYWRAHQAENTAAHIEDYKYYKSRGICVACRKEPAAVMPDGHRQILCQACREKRNALAMQRRERNKTTTKDIITRREKKQNGYKH